LKGGRLTFVAAQSGVRALEIITARAGSEET